MFARRLQVLLVPIAALLPWVACLEQRFPGEQVMGSYEFTAVPKAVGCDPLEFQEVGDGGSVEPFSFQATFSRSPDNEEVWLTVQGVNREASFDGQVAESTHEAPRTFATCACDTTRVKETVRVALLSQSQLEAIKAGPSRNPDGGDCPIAALDGGVPAADGVIKGPGAGEGDSFDAVRACGELVDEILPAAGCTCEPCTLVYELVGVSR